MKYWGNQMISVTGVILFVLTKEEHELGEAEGTIVRTLESLNKAISKLEGQEVIIASPEGLVIPPENARILLDYQDNEITAMMDRVTREREAKYSSHDWVKLLPFLPVSDKESLLKLKGIPKDERVTRYVRSQRNDRYSAIYTLLVALSDETFAQVMEKLEEA